MSKKEPNTEEKVDFVETVEEEKASDLTLDQRLQLLQLERQFRMKERDAEREKCEDERQVKRETSNKKEIRESERTTEEQVEQHRKLRNEKKEFAIREAGWIILLKVDA